MLSLVGHGTALGQTAQLERRLTELTALLVHEHRLIEELRQALLHQRTGVATKDAEVIDASVGAVGRTLLTIDAARRCRTGVVAEITGDAETPLADLERRLRRTLPEPLAQAREQIRRAADGAAREVAINQHILRRALEEGDAFLQRLFSSKETDTCSY
jgi:hypothetical protein